jgi:hypothetical protein
MKEFVVKQESDLFAYLLSLGFKRARLKQLLKYRALSVNGRPVERHDHHLPATGFFSRLRKKQPPALLRNSAFK